MPDMSTQLAQEQRMRDRGADRARRTQSRQETAETPAGIQLAKKAVEPLTNAIRAFLAPSKGAGRRHTAAKLLAGVDPELAAYITVRSTLNFASGRKTLHSAAMGLTEALEAELIADQFETVNGALYRAVIRNAEARGLSPSRQLKSIMLANRKFNLVDRPWTPQERLRLGVKLIELFIESVGIVRAFYRRTGAKTSHYLEFTEDIDAWMAKYNAAATLARPMRLPTVVPPRPWTSVRGGGYFTGRPEPIVTKAFPGQMEALEQADLSAVYKGLNGLQDTGWRINRSVMAVMSQAWAKGLEGLPLPRHEPMTRPEAPQEVRDAAPGSEVRRAWRREMRDWHLADQKDKSRRFEWSRALALAEEHTQYEALYFPCRLDFRGRVYSAGTTLHPQGPEECRALLEFAEGKPLGERGVFWLGVHGANLFGNDKVSLAERYEWACEHVREAQACACDPLSNRWWTEADKPWSFLAWAFEWAAAWTYPQHPHGFVSHMPVALDGTCNGLQHYSAMLRDEVGGKAVNLVPGDKPNDIYADVAAPIRDKSLAGKRWAGDVALPHLLHDRDDVAGPAHVTPSDGGTSSGVSTWPTSSRAI